MYSVQSTDRYFGEVEIMVNPATARTYYIVIRDGVVSEGAIYQTCMELQTLHSTKAVSTVCVLASTLWPTCISHLDTVFMLFTVIWVGSRTWDTKLKERGNVG